MCPKKGCTITCTKMHYGQVKCKYGRMCEQRETCYRYHPLPISFEERPCPERGDCFDATCKFQHLKSNNSNLTIEYVPVNPKRSLYGL